jgi:molybdopterin/thiamine biosynthesis adenylyltransferase/rhodanese-related sulfurtransferase
MSLTPAQHARYARHTALPEVGVAGQARLLASRVLVIGAGGLGSPVALYLAAAGVGTIGIVDDDVVDVTNLQRQIVHTTARVGQPKVDSAQDALTQLNPEITVVPHHQRVTIDNVLALIDAYDVVIDATDSFATRYLVNDACVMRQKPLVYGAIFRFEGQVSVFGPHLGGPCYRCLFPDPPPPELAPNCAQAGVFGVLPGVVGCVQATEAIKLILGIGESLMGQLWMYDALSMQVDRWQVAGNPACARCGNQPTLCDLIDMDALCATPTPPTAEIDAQTLAQRIAREPVFLLDVREPHEYDAGHLTGAVRIGVDEVANQSAQLASHTEIVVYCRSGMRSARAADILRQRGINAVSLTGGLLAWQRQIDATIIVA